MPKTVAVTGATGLVGRHLVRTLAESGRNLRCLTRADSDRSGIDLPDGSEWFEGDLADAGSLVGLVEGVDAVVQAALLRPQGSGFRGAAEEHFEEFLQANLIGSLRLMQAAQDAGAGRFVYVSSCAVHEEILDDRPLDETHPLWPKTHYGAHKAAVEAFVSSFGRGDGWPVCAVRPTGIYGLTHPPEDSKWFGLVHAVAAGEQPKTDGGGKEVHAGDVAHAIALLLDAPADAVAGECFNCYDMYVTKAQVARIAAESAGVPWRPPEGDTQPKHQIETGKLRGLGMTFGGDGLLRRTVEEMLDVHSAAGV